MKMRTALGAMAFVLIAGCTSRPIYNVADAPVVTSGKAASMQDVQGAIIRAGSSLGWKMSPAEPGLVVGRLDLRTHTAIVNVRYDVKTYSITYKESVNLDADGTNIHKNYNGWIENLDRGIRSELLRV
jgi:hypothetical protein